MLDFNLVELNRNNFKAFREQIAKRPLLPFAFLEVVPRPVYKDALTKANLYISEGFHKPTIKCPFIKLIPPISWVIKDDAVRLRSIEYNLHSWLPMQHILCAFEFTKLWEYFQFAFNMAEDWIIACPTQLANKSIEDAIALVTNEHYEGSWWYDSAIAQRLNLLAYLVDVSCRRPEISDNRIFAMMDHLLLHNALLNSDLFYKKHSNHGLLQVLCQYAAITRLPEFDYQGYFLKTAHNRLQQMITQQYTSEMVHREHSPGYHYMLTVALVNASRAKIFNRDKSFISKLRQAEQNLVWMVIPSGEIAPLGDTLCRNLFNQTDIDFFEEPILVQALSEHAHLTGVKHFPEAGYAFARLYAPEVDRTKALKASYLAQISGFHSRVHKHADHLSFIWFDRERNILIDPGLYGYIGRTKKDSDLFNEGFWYSDPKRIYCERTRAHNTVEIDGKDFPRKNVKPFGSALLYAEEKNGNAVTYSSVRHFKSILHQRQLIMRPGHFLLVLDWLKDSDSSEHEYKQYFHFGNEWNVSNQGDQIIGHHSGNEKAEAIDLRVVSLIAQSSIGKVVRGQEEPELLGWLSNDPQSLIPTSCFHVYQRSDKPVSFATLFVFGKKLDINWQKTRFNNSLSAGKVVWSDDLGEQVLDITKLA
jgi:hypothetical protein